jgi:hypothetical protein
MTEYWEKHYSSGGVSGHGDTNESYRWKRNLMLSNGFRPDKSVIDVGCGDMTFWKDISLLDYTGIDISRSQIDKNIEEYPNYKFFCENSAQHLDLQRAEVVVCFDILFHIMEEKDYINTLLNLADYSKDKIFIYTWGKNPFKSFKNRLIIKKPFSKDIVTDGKYQYYRDFKYFSKLFIERYFDLVNTFTDKRWEYGELFYYEKKEG